MKSIIKVLFCMLIPMLANAQNSKIDSLQREVNRYQKKDSLRVKKLYTLANALPYNENEKAEAIYLQAEKLAGKIGWKKGEAYVLAMLSGFYGDQKQFDKSISAGLKAIDIAAELNDSSLISSTDLLMGGIYRYMGDYKEAEDYALKAMKQGRVSKNEHAILEAYNLFLDIYSSQGKWDKFHIYADTAKKLATQLNDTHTTERILGFLAEEQNEKKYYAKANDYYLQYLKGVEKSNNLVMISYTSSRLSINYASMKQIDSAFYYAKRSLDMCFQNKFDPDVAYEAYYHAYNAANDYKNALKYYLLYDSCVKSSYNMNAGQNVAVVKARSEQDKKNAITNAELKRQQQIRNGSILFSGIVALFAIVFLRQRNKTKEEKQKAENALTELKSTQSQLIQSEKMASLGELTAGIAHEIQNPLNFVNNFSEVNTELIEELVEEVDKGNTSEVKAIAKDIKENEQKINHHGKRADAIVKGMLQHSRSSNGQKEPTDINALADEYLRLAYHGLRAKDKSFNATLKTDYDEKIDKINVIPQDIGRVILNLITNAFYVVDEKKKTGSPGYEPTVSVSTKFSPLLGRGVGGEVLIIVKDNGNGIPQKILDKIFQPFFTTKPTGQGTGLGLSLSYDIVKAHGGELKVETKEGEGTIFIISIPG
ncbi:MAG: hypothetical protein KAY50_06645 [Chitinophagaceae bacterium]|nr:hypothetical protein [Chitinophagaceae bacterium]